MRQGLVGSAAAPAGGIPIAQPVEVIQDTHDDLNANANIQIDDTDVSDANAVPTDEWVETEAAWATLINAIRLDDDPTSYSSAAQDSDGYAGAWVLIDIDSTLAPTDIRILAQWSHDGGTTWWDFVEGLWASLYWEDTATAAGILQAFNLPLGGIDTWRIRAIGTGTDANNYFDVTVLARCYRGSVGIAHA